jgi:hypothetical protein
MLLLLLPPLQTWVSLQLHQAYPQLLMQVLQLVATQPAAAAAAL